MDFLVFHGRNEARANDHEFCFQGDNFHCLNFGLFYDAIVFPNVSNSSGHIGLLDASICYDSDLMLGYLGLLEGLIKVIKVFMNIFFVQ